MNPNKFKKEIKKIIPLVFTYGAAFYKIKQFSDLDRIDKAGFIRKCNEGFKMAQEKILYNILEIEEEEKIIKNDIKLMKKGKHDDLLKDESYQKLLKKYDILKIQIFSFRNLADALAWTIMGMDRTWIRSFLIDNGGSGFLQDRDIESSIAGARELNKSLDGFSLITDITSCLHKGDIMTIKENGHIIFTEMKKKTEINNLVSNFTENIVKTGKINKGILKKIHDKSPKKGLQQINRFLKQLTSIYESIKFIKKGKCFDSRFNMERVVVPSDTIDKDFIDLVEGGLKKLYYSKSKYLILPFDCCLVGLFKKGAGSTFVKKMDFRHNVYHHITKPIEECGYLKEDYTELQEYYKLKIYNFLELLFLPGLKPIFFILKDSYTLGLLMGEIDIYIYFDIERFFAMCKEKGLNPEWVKNRNYGSEFVMANGKCLRVNSKMGKIIVGNGLIYPIIYEFKSGYNVIEQLLK